MTGIKTKERDRARRASMQMGKTPTSDDDSLSSVCIDTIDMFGAEIVSADTDIEIDFVYSVNRSYYRGFEPDSRAEPTNTHGRYRIDTQTHKPESEVVTIGCLSGKLHELDEGDDVTLLFDSDPDGFEGGYVIDGINEVEIETREILDEDGEPLVNSSVGAYAVRLIPLAE